MFKDKKVHIIGIGGVSMSGIAELLSTMGAKVSGSDVKDSKITKHLESLGIEVFYGHHPHLIKDKDIIIYSAAVKEDDPERKEATRLKKETYERATILGKITSLYQNCLCIAGTHGKSTTTGMLSLIFLEAKLNPTIQIGAILPEINSTSKIGDNKYLILESCEYMDSFLKFCPSASIITNIDNDHLDYFKNLAKIKESFNNFAKLLPAKGFLIKNNDDKNSINVEKDTKAQIITFGINNKADFEARNISCNDSGFYNFDVYHKEKLYFHLNLNINGYHNIYNSLAVTALAYNYIKDKNIIKKGLEKYHGVERRFEFIGKYKNALIYDDFAHHPTEIKTTWENCQKIKHHETWAIFQSHTFSRTKEHLKDFAKILSKFDHIVIAKIYPAREKNIYNITEDMLVEEIKKLNSNVLYIAEFVDIATYIKDNIQNNDLVITIGAGPINQVALKIIGKN